MDERLEWERVVKTTGSDRIVLVVIPMERDARDRPRWSPVSRADDALVTWEDAAWQ